MEAAVFIILPLMFLMLGLGYLVIGRVTERFSTVRFSGANSRAVMLAERYMVQAALAKTELGAALAIPNPSDRAMREIEKSKEELGKAGLEEGQGDYGKAIDHYKHAWEHALHALESSE